MLKIYQFLFYKTGYPNKEVKSTEPSFSVRVPCVSFGVLLYCSRRILLKNCDKIQGQDDAKFLNE
jgi:hypothetical protein